MSRTTKVRDLSTARTWPLWLSSYLWVSIFFIFIADNSLSHDQKPDYQKLLEFITYNFHQREGIDIAFTFSSSQFLGKVFNWSILGQVIVSTSIYLLWSEGTVTLKHGFSHLNLVIRKGGGTISKRRVEGIVFQKINNRCQSHFQISYPAPLLLAYMSFCFLPVPLSSLDYLPVLYGLEALLPGRSPCLHPLVSITFVQEFPLNDVS